MESTIRFDDVRLEHPTIATVGVYDGIHRGHQALLSSLVAHSREKNLESVVITFFPHPDAVIRGITGRYYLTPPTQRVRLLHELGIDHVLVLPFDNSLRNMRAATFVEHLTERIKVRELWVGRDFALGYKREGNIAFLTAAGQEMGFTVVPVDLVQSNGGDAITSTAIRGHLEAGRIDKANRLMGRPYLLEGEVVHGDQRGRTIGFPTANIAVWDQQIVPRFGVYAGWLTVNGEQHMAVTNIGIRPTFAGKAETVEAHILDFSADIYGENVSLALHHFIRPEMRFDGIDSLKAQLSADVERGRQLLAG